MNARFGLERLLIAVLTVAAIWGVLSWGSQNSGLVVNVGEVSPEKFVASETVSDIVDEDAFEAAQQAAREEVEPIYSTSNEKIDLIISEITDFFDLVEANALSPGGELTVPIGNPFTLLPEEEITETTVDGEEPVTTTTAAPTNVTVTGTFFLDLDGDGILSIDAGDEPLSNVNIHVSDSTGELVTVRTDISGMATAEVQTYGPLVVEVDTDDQDFPEHFVLATTNNPQVVTDISGESIDLSPVGFSPNVRTTELQIGLLADQFEFIYEASLPTLVAIATEDVTREALGQESNLAIVKFDTIDRARDLLAAGIADEDLPSVRKLALDRPPFIVLDEEEASEAQNAGADVIYYYLIPTTELDEAQTAEAQDVAAAAVLQEAFEVGFERNQTIVDEGEVVTPVQLAAIDQLNLLRPTATQYAALAALVTLLVTVIFGYIGRFRPKFWMSARRVGLFGSLMVLAALAVRLSSELESFIPSIEGLSGYAIPAAGFGFLVAILFDARMAVIMAMSIAAVTAIATGDAGSATYALLSAIGPAPFVSSISNRAAFRRALVYASAAAAVLAMATAWFFTVPLMDAAADDVVTRAGVLALIVSLVTTLASGMALSFFEVLFDITTTLRLLDVTDRNHPALMLLQEEAWGSFNHSLMVGTLAENAARSIGANNLLALAAAYYHDLGKTQQPTYFIENQFGIGNPHDHLPPQESAAIIRQHVIDGIELAKKYRIPSEVAEGIVCHHGDGIMQFFYRKAIELYGEENVDVDDYRHIGHKPQTRELAIVMMADAIEGASRAIFNEEDPSPQRISEVVERIVGEKVSDGQLSASDLTLGELTQVKRAFVEALVGHYHQRIPYPDFPDSEAIDGSGAPALDVSNSSAATAEPIESDPMEITDAEIVEESPDVIPMRRKKEL